MKVTRIIRFFIWSPSNELNINVNNVSNLLRFYFILPFDYPNFLHYYKITIPTRNFQNKDKNLCEKICELNFVKKFWKKFAAKKSLVNCFCIFTNTFLMSENFFSHTTFRKTY